MSEEYKWKGESVSLREYIDLRFEQAERAIDKSESNLARRLEGMNEFRDQLREQAAQFVTRETLDLMVDALRLDIKSLQLSRATLQGKASQSSVMWAYILAVAGLVLGAISLFR